MSRFRIRTLMVVVAFSGVAAWGWVFLAGMDADSRSFILVIAGTLGAVPVFALAVATVASALVRWASPPTGSGDKARGRSPAMEWETIDRQLDRIWREER